MRRGGEVAAHRLAQTVIHVPKRGETLTESEARRHDDLHASLAAMLDVSLRDRRVASPPPGTCYTCKDISRNFFFIL